MVILFSFVVQLDGRPMSGDIGAGATRAAVALAARVAASEGCPPGIPPETCTSSCRCFFCGSEKVVLSGFSEHLNP